MRAYCEDKTRRLIRALFSQSFQARVSYDELLHSGCPRTKSNANSLEEFLDGALGFVNDGFEVFLDVGVGGAVAFERVDDDTGAEEF